MVRSRADKLRVVRLASTVVGSTVEALNALPYKNAIKFANEKVHFNSVLTWTDNRSESLMSLYACAMTGLRLVTVSPKINDADVLV